MSVVLNELICEIIGDAYIPHDVPLPAGLTLAPFEKTDEAKQEYEYELKHELFNSYLEHYEADNINMREYIKIFKTLYHYYKDELDMGDNVVDALDDKQKLFNLYALMMFDELVDEALRNKKEEEDEEEEVPHPADRYR